MFNLLYVNWDVNPILLQIGPLAIRYYSLLFIAGFPLGYWLFQKFYKREGVNQDLLEPLLYALLLGTIVGARLGHCFFYEPQYYLQHPGEILKVWHGGLASHGGAIGVLLAIEHGRDVFNVPFALMLPFTHDSGRAVVLRPHPRHLSPCPQAAERGNAGVERVVAVGLDVVDEHDVLFPDRFCVLEVEGGAGRIGLRQRSHPHGRYGGRGAFRDPPSVRKS